MWCGIPWIVKLDAKSNRGLFLLWIISLAERSNADKSSSERLAFSSLAGNDVTVQWYRYVGMLFISKNCGHLQNKQSMMSTKNSIACNVDKHYIHWYWRATYPLYAFCTFRYEGKNLKPTEHRNYMYTRMKIFTSSSTLVTRSSGLSSDSSNATSDTPNWILIGGCEVFAATCQWEWLSQKISN